MLKGPMEIDQRHVEWIQRTVEALKPRRTLEIGAYKGNSTKAFHGVPDHHVCETVPQATYYGTLHVCKSVELLSRDTDWDLVLIDGDHTIQNVMEEARFLINTPSIFAHDVCAAMYGCPGPQYLWAAFQAAGYYCLVDAVQRRGELTDRGMLFATLDLTSYAHALAAWRATCGG